jgi:hypothetical protein
MNKHILFVKDFFQKRNLDCAFFIDLLTHRNRRDPDGDGGFWEA